MSTERIQLEPDEKVLIQVRKHWFVLAIQIFFLTLAGLIPAVLYPILTKSVPIIDLTSYTDILLLLYLVWLLVIWMALFGVWTNYYLDVWTITSKRLIAIDQRGLFYRNTGSFRLERLQDINVSIRGIIATFLDFGDIEAETASGDRNFIATNIPRPRELKSLILSATDATTYGQNKSVDGV